MARKKPTESPTTVVELKKLLFELEKNILDVKKQISAEDKKSADFLEKMAKLDAIRSKNRNEYYRIMGQIDKIEKESLKTQEKGRKIEKGINEEVEKTVKSAGKRLSSQINHNRLKEKERNFEKEIGGLQEKSAILMRSVNESVLKKAQALKISGQAVSQIADKTTEIKKLFKGTKEETQAFEKTLGETVKNASGIDTLSAKIVENMENMKKKGYELIDTYQLEKDLKEQSVRLDLNAKKLGAERYVLQRKLVDDQMKEFQKLKQINQQMAEKAKSAKESRAAMIGFLAAVPGGAFIMNKMGLGKILDGTKTIKQTIKDWGTAAKGFALALPGMALMGIFSLLVTVVKKLIGVVFELDQDIADLSKQFAVSRNRAEALFGTLGKLSLRMNIVGVNVKELAKTLEDLTEEYGTSLERLQSASLQNGMLQGITLLREKWQLTNEEAFNFYRNSTAMGMSMDKLAQVTSTVTKNVLSQRQAFKMMANIPMTMVTGFKGAVRELASFAAKAKIMGVDLRVFQDALKASMDVETSLEDQMTAEVITGVHFAEMDAMRYAADNRDFEKAMEHRITMLNRLQEKFGKGLERARQSDLTASAKVFNIDEDELVRQATRLGEIQQQFGRGSIKTVKKMLEDNKKLVGKGGAAGFILGETTSKEGASVAEKFQDDMEKIKTELKDKLLPIVDEMHKFYNELKPQIKEIVSTLADALPGIVDTTVKLLGIAKDIATTILGLFEPIMKVMEWMGMITVTQEQQADGTTKQVRTLNAEWFSMTNILATIAGYFTGKALLVMGVRKLGEVLKGTLKSGWEGLKNWATGANKVVESVDDVKNTGTKSKTKNIQNTASKKSGTPKRGSYQWKPSTPKTGGGGGGFMSKLGKKLLNPKNLMKNAGKGGVVGLLGGMVADATLGMASDYYREKGDVKTASGLDVGSSALSGAMLGGTIGSIVPGVGTAIGAGVGGLLGAGYGLYQNAGTLFGGGDKQQQAAQQQKPQQAMAQQAAGMSRQSAEELKKLNEQMQILGGDRTWQASKAVNQVAKSIVTLSEGLSTFVKMGGNMMLPFIVKTFDSVNNSKIYSFASGISSVSTSISDLTKKLSKLDVAKLERVTQITNPGLLSTVSSAAGSLFGGVKSFFGFGGNEGAKTSTVPSTYSTVSSGNKTSGGTTNQSGVSVNVNTSALEQKIDKLIAVIGNMASQPTYIKIGERTVEAISSEIDFRKNKEVGLQKYGGI
jgi:hypothetical protein